MRNAALAINGTSIDHSKFTREPGVYRAIDYTMIDPLPRMLYHYTTAAGLHGIMSTPHPVGERPFGVRNMWASDVTFLNDSEEMQHGFRRIIDAAAASASGRPWLPDVVKPALDGRVGKPRDRTYAISLSANGDQLSQWRAYGKSGGFALGLPTSGRAESPAGSIALATKTEGVSFGKVIYDPTLQQRSAEELIREFLEYFEPAMLSGDTALQLSLTTQFASNAVRLAAFMKHEAFSEEAEYRITKTTNARDYKTRLSGGVDIPYIEIPIIPNTGVLSDLTVVVGPRSSGDRDTATRSVRALWHGYGVGVVHSKIPYRERA
ncbi:MAG TPA: DUF2971 domain-containing protein [Gemmatimonadaceae bacterium]